MPGYFDNLKKSCIFAKNLIGYINMNEDVKVDVEDNIDYKDLYIRLLADHDNYVKRTNDTISNLSRLSQSNTIVDTVFVVYNDLRCGVMQGLFDGSLLLRKMQSLIEKCDYAIIDEMFINDQLGGKFDVSYCEAISTVPSTGDDVNDVQLVIKAGLFDKKTNKTIVHAQCIVKI